VAYKALAWIGRASQETASGERHKHQSWLCEPSQRPDERGYDVGTVEVLLDMERRWRASPVTKDNNVLHQIVVEPFETLKAGQRCGAALSRVRGEAYQLPGVFVAIGNLAQHEPLAIDLKYDPHQLGGRSSHIKDYHPQKTQRTDGTKDGAELGLGFNRSNSERGLAEAGEQSAWRRAGRLENSARRRIGLCYLTRWGHRRHVT